MPSDFSLCLFANESVKHLFVECLFAKRVWEWLGLDIDIPHVSSFTDWAYAIMQNFQIEHKFLIMTTCWSIWNVRNAKIWNNTEFVVLSAVEGGKCFLSSWRDANSKPEPGRLHEDNNITRWSKPQPGYLKVNVDASVNLSSHIMGLGASFAMRMDGWWLPRILSIKDLLLLQI